MKDYMVMELQHVSEMVAIKMKVDVILKTFWRPNYNPLSHDQTRCNINMMTASDSYYHGHNVLALRNCRISTDYDLFEVLLPLGLVRAP